MERPSVSFTGIWTSCRRETLFFLATRASHTRCWSFLPHRVLLPSGYLHCSSSLEPSGFCWFAVSRQSCSFQCDNGNTHWGCVQQFLDIWPCGHECWIMSSRKNIWNLVERWALLAQRSLKRQCETTVRRDLMSSETVNRRTSQIQYESCAEYARKLKKQDLTNSSKHCAVEVCQRATYLGRQHTMYTRKSPCWTSYTSVYRVLWGCARFHLAFSVRAKSTWASPSVVPLRLLLLLEMVVGGGTCRWYVVAVLRRVGVPQSSIACFAFCFSCPIYGSFLQQ